MPFVSINVEEAIDDNLPVDKENLRGLLLEIQARLGDLPDDYSDFASCEAVALSAAGTGPAVASEGTEPIGFAGRALGDYATDNVEIDGAIALNFREHAGRLLIKTSESATTLYLDPTDDRETGVQAGFSCSIWRELDAGAVQLVSSSMVNAHPSGHTQVQAGGIATVVCNPDRLLWRLAGETEV